MKNSQKAAPPTLALPHPRLVEATDPQSLESHREAADPHTPQSWNREELLAWNSEEPQAPAGVMGRRAPDDPRQHVWRVWIMTVVAQDHD